MAKQEDTQNILAAKFTTTINVSEARLRGGQDNRIELHWNAGHAYEMVLGKVNKILVLPDVYVE